MFQPSFPTHFQLFAKPSFNPCSFTTSTSEATELFLLALRVSRDICIKRSSPIPDQPCFTGEASVTHTPRQHVDLKSCSQDPLLPSVHQEESQLARSHAMWQAHPMPVILLMSHTATLLWFFDSWAPKSKQLRYLTFPSFPQEKVDLRVDVKIRGWWNWKTSRLYYRIQGLLLLWRDFQFTLNTHLQHTKQLSPQTKSKQAVNQNLVKLLFFNGLHATPSITSPILPVSETVWCRVAGPLPVPSLESLYFPQMRNIQQMRNKAV